MKNITLLGVALLYILSLQAQELPNRYIDEITNDVQITQDVNFSTNIPTIRTINLFGNKLANEESYGEVRTTLKMDIYRPSNDNFRQRPVIIFAFGGGFVNGTRKERSMIRLCEAFARRGFVTATIDYRLGMHIGDSELAKRAVYRALQDGRSAVRFFRKNASAYGIDPNQIYISGHSAGAFLAYQSVYLDKDSERPESTRNYFGRQDLGGLDDIGDNKSYSGKANGVMGFAGAVGELGDIENSSDVPGVYFHSSDDGTVPYNSGEPFSGLNWIPGINLPIVYGSNQMSRRASNVNAPHIFYPYTNRGHSVHFDGSNLYAEIAPNGARFFYDNNLKPAATTITADSCGGCTTRTYTATNDQEFYYDWQITGGVFEDRDPSSNVVTVRWNGTSSNRSLTVTPYSQYLARGASYRIDEDGNPNADPCDWQQTSGRAIDVGVANGETYVIGNNRLAYRWNNGNWIQLGDISNFARIDAQEDRIPWAITTNNTIWSYVNGTWDQKRGRAKDIGINRSHIYIVGSNNSLYKYNGNNRWNRIRGKSLKRLDAAVNGDAWVVGSDDYVYQVQNGNYTGRKGDFKASDITVVENTNTVWAIQLGTGVPHKYVGNGNWERFRGVLTTISGDRNGELWGTNASTNIFNNNCFNTDNKNIVAASENPIRADLKLYPNPASQRVNINVTSYNGKTINVVFTNVLGQSVLAKTFDNTDRNKMSMDVSVLRKGLYIVRIELEKQEFITKQLMVD